MMTHECSAKSSTSYLNIFADGNSGIQHGLITNGRKKTSSAEVGLLLSCSVDNILSLIVN